MIEAGKDRGFGDAAPGGVDKEKRIRFDTIKRRRAHALRAKLDEESEEKRYSEALSKRQNVKQEYVQLVRKQFRYWRKQGSPSPYRNKATAASPEAQWDMCPTGTPTTPWQAGSVENVTAVNVEPNIKVFTDAAINSRTSGGDAGKGRDGFVSSRPRLGTREVSGMENWLGEEETGEAAIEQAAGRGANQLSGRWANLPPELMAIKDRWLGASVEDLATAKTATPADDNDNRDGEDQEEYHQDPQERHDEPTPGVQKGTSDPATVESPAVSMHTTSNTAFTRAPIAGPARLLKGDGGNKTPCEGEPWQGGSEDLSSRGRMSTDSLERSSVQGTAPKSRQRHQRSLPYRTGPVEHECPVNTLSEGGNVVGDTVRAEVAKKSTLADTRADDCEVGVRGDGDGMSIVLQGEECSDIDSVIDAGEVGDSRKNQSHEHARNQLQVLRGRLSRGKPGENRPEISPSCRLKSGNELSAGVRKHRQESPPVTPGAGIGLKGETPKVVVAENSAVPYSEDTRGKEDRCGVLGTSLPQEHHGTAREIAGAVDLGESDNGGGVLQPEGSVTSRPSELFDSLELSVSASHNGGPFGPFGRGRPGQSCAEEKARAPSERLTTSTEQITSMDVPAPELKIRADIDIGESLEPTVERCAATKAATVTDHAVTGHVGTISVVRIARTHSRVGGTSISADSTVSFSVRPPDRESDEVQTELKPPVRVLASPPTATVKNVSKAGAQSGHKPRGPPGSSKLRAPGWGRGVTMTPIPPAVTVTELISSDAVDGVVPYAKEAEVVFVPGHLLTPVTEETPVDERSAISYSTPGTARMTPASSAASGSRLDAARHRPSERSPSPMVGDCGHPQLVASRVGSHESIGTDSGDRNRRGRALWGDDVRSGAHSAPGGNMSGSSLAYRSLQSGGVVGTRGSTFSSDSDRGAGGGYVAVMGRRARSVARCEAARRLVAIARANGKVRPSTPIEERARWGKGRETRTDVERRKLLRRRSEYAGELMRKAKEDAADLAARRKMTTSSKDRSRGGGVTPPIALQHNGPVYDPASPADNARGSRAGATIPRALKADVVLATKGLGDMGGNANCAHLFPCEASRKFPAHRCLEHALEEVERVVGDNRTGFGGVGSGAGRRSTCRDGTGNGHDSFVRGREAGRQRMSAAGSTAQAVVGDEEKQLMASIARLDTLLQKERSSIATSSTDSGGGGSRAETQERLGGSKGGTERNIKLPQNLGITKSRVRKGSGKDTKTCDPVFPDGATSAEASVLASTMTVVSSGLATTAAGVSAAPLFPSVHRGSPLPENRLDDGRYRQLETETKHDRDTMATGMSRGFPDEGQGPRDHGRITPIRTTVARPPGRVLPETSRQPTFTGHQEAPRRENRAPEREFYRPPREYQRPTFTPPWRTVDTCPDDYGRARRSPRYPERQEEGRMEPGPLMPTTYRGGSPEVGRQDLRWGFDGERYAIHCRDERRGYGEDAQLAADPPDVWSREVERQGWERESLHRGGYLDERSNARDRNDRTAWVGARYFWKVCSTVKTSEK